MADESMACGQCECCARLLKDCDELAQEAHEMLQCAEQAEAERDALRENHAHAERRVDELLEEVAALKAQVIPEADRERALALMREAEQAAMLPEDVALEAEARRLLRLPEQP
jgi:hypothetical protein